MDIITILIADDHRLIRETWKTILDGNKRFKVISTSGTGNQAISLTKELKPNVVIMDINLPDISGFEATKLIRKYSPLSAILAVSLHNQPSYVKKMFQVGASGYVTKNSSSQELYRAIIEISEGRKYVCDEIKNIIADQAMFEGKTGGLHSLTLREIEIISLLKQGYSSKQIASLLEISIKTVEVHRQNIYKKLGLKNVTSLVNYIHNNNLDI